MAPVRKRALIVSPRFPPINAADLHRIRTSLPYFSKNGWDVEVLALTPETSDGVEDPALLETVPAEIPVRRVRAVSEQLTRRFGFGHVDLRSFFPMYRAGSRLLSESRFDLVYFSSTVFSLFVLGRIWKRRFGIKVVFDIQDPWYEERKSLYDAATAPGGLRKYRVSQWINKRLERIAMRAADHIVVVSAGYSATLQRRYGWLSPAMFSTIPFGAAPRDFEIFRELKTRQTLFAKDDGLRHWVYVGRGGPDMVPIVSILFQALARLREREPELINRLRLHFVGTSYAPLARTSKSVEPVAERWGVLDLVQEHSGRVPYFEALALLRDSDALILLGSTIAEYTASKLFNYVLAEKPTLAIFSAGSLVAKLATRVPWVRIALFSSDPNEAGFDSEVEKGVRWLAEGPSIPAGSWSALEAYSAEELTRVQCEIFDQVLDR